MTLVYTHEQRQLKDSAADFVRQEMPVAALRALRDNPERPPYNTQHWQKMAALGWPAMIIPEDYDGLGFGYMGLGAVLEELGKSLAASPLFSSVALGASALCLGGSSRQKQEMLPQIASGALRVALALEEQPQHRPLDIGLRATASDTGFVLNGEKTFVLDGSSADIIIVAARTAGQPGTADGISLFLVNRDTEGLQTTRHQLLDSRDAASLQFNNVKLTQSALLGEYDQGWPLLDAVLDRGRICLAAEMLGSATECFERTVAYLKQRKQFGVAIGSFQALQHRAAIMFTELELAKSVVLDALSALDDDRQDIAQMASLAKATLNDVFQLVTNEAVQMHGGIGVTDELDIGLFLKRSRVCNQILGHSGFHRDRYASLCGY